MHSELIVSAASGSYRIIIGSGCSREAVASASAVVMDAALLGLLPESAHDPITLVADESIKTLSGVEALALALRERGANRRSTMCAIGGGSIQDVATLTAALYMRGINWTYVPTTLMAMADSCIGGKSAINAGGYKNLLGNFNPPSVIFVDPDLALTQSDSDLMSGVAEAVKICYASGSEVFRGFVAQVRLDGELGPNVIESLVTAALGAKKRIVEADEFDTGERQLLNFGHTFGHALEAATQFGLPHGLGVAVGMRAALRHPQAGSTSDTEQLDSYAAQLLGRAGKSGWRVPKVDWEQFRRAFESDKKHLADTFRLVLPGSDGRLVLASVERSAASLELCVHAARAALSQTELESQGLEFQGLEFQGLEFQGLESQGLKSEGPAKLEGRL